MSCSTAGHIGIGVVSLRAVLQGVIIKLTISIHIELVVHGDVSVDQNFAFASSSIASDSGPLDEILGESWVASGVSAG